MRASTLQVRQHNQAGSPLNIVSETLTVRTDSIAIAVPMQVRITSFLSGNSSPWPPMWTMSKGARKRRVRYSCAVVSESATCACEKLTHVAQHFHQCQCQENSNLCKTNDTYLVPRSVGQTTSYVVSTDCESNHFGVSLLFHSNACHDSIRYEYTDTAQNVLGCLVARVDWPGDDVGSFDQEQEA